jgi:5'-deoxynucleotidase YfbR-like HD superfamily hydrolase
VSAAAVQDRAIVSGPTIQTHSGLFFDFLNPQRDQIDIRDIAIALSNVCRFTGHVDAFYSVAQHSVHVSRLVPPEHAFAGLMHDAAEAYIGDVAKPLKLLLPDYKAIEDRVEAAVFAAFGLPAKLPECVKRADLVALSTEKRDLKRHSPQLWDCLGAVRPDLARILPASPVQAYWMFMRRFDELVIAMGAGLLAGVKSA